MLFVIAICTKLQFKASVPNHPQPEAVFQRTSSLLQVQCVLGNTCSYSQGFRLASAPQ